MCDPVTLGTALGASTATAASVGTMAYLGAGSMLMQKLSGDKAASAQAEAGDKATQAAADAAVKADQANNRANGKQPDLMGIDSANAQAAKGGISGTLLTGPQGVDPKTLLLGKATLLGA